MMMTSNTNLPEDIVVRILLNLPVKSLTRFICVCKTWYALIKGNTFIQRHLHHGTEHLLAIYSVPGSSRRRTFKFLSDDFAGDVDPSFCNALQDFPVVYGHCGGIFCLYHSTYGRGLLWNPANREMRTLPKFPREYKQQRSWYGLRFGWDERTNDYKVVVFSSVHDSWDKIYETYMDDCNIVDVYSTRTDSWRRFEGKVPFEYLDICTNIKCLDGVFYWFHERHENGRFLSFRIGDEVFEEIVLPDFLLGVCSYKTTLDKYNDHLAIIYGDTTMDDKCFEIWVLFQSCWNKALTIGPFTRIQRSLGFGEHGEILFYSGERGDHILIYDPQSQELNDPGIHGTGIEVLPYKESLVSVKRIVVKDNFSDVINIANLFS